MSLVVAGSRSSLDYYLVRAELGDGEPAAKAEAVVVEEFTRQTDFTTVGLDSAGWTPSGAGWWSSASLGRSMRTDATLLARVVPTGRGVAESVYRELGGGQLPDEAVLRTYFRDHHPIPTAPPLRLGPAQPPAGFHERRVYRVLFAKDLQEEQLVSIRAAWSTPTGGTPGSVAAGHRLRGGDQFAWELRRVGRGLAWCLDLTALLRGAASDEVGPILSELTHTMRGRGLIPVTTERFA
ncbi:hypothetical protein [Micromonospora vulcania]|uniref:Uncharacterized protein n=1 Tax=Micromonospora vulcania TaxID=1441873 RepID=A0ABW1H596_9ACTN